MAQRPQDLAKTLDDFRRIGKGVAIGETFDLVGLPADAADAFFSIRKALFPYSDLGEARAAEELAKGIGSEALIKKAGIDIPEMGFNLESAGRVMAPGFLLTKGAIGLKLLSQMMDKTPPPAGGLAMATVGASKIPAPPPTTAEQLMMTTDQTLPSMPEPPKKADVFEDDYLKKDVSLAARMSTDNVFYSNLLQEIENLGTGQGELQQIIQTRMPMLETFTTKKGKTAQRPVRDDAGNIMYEKGVTTRVEGIEFPMTGEQILEKFKTLKGGINSRLYKEAEEVGLIR
jgi:disulfide oxidoreductase YuzD